MGWLALLFSCWSSNTTFPLWLAGHPPLLTPWLMSCSASPAWLMAWPAFQAPCLPSGSQTLTGILLPGTELLWTDIWEQPHLGMAWGISVSTPPSSWACPPPPPPPPPKNYSLPVLMGLILGWNDLFSSIARFIFVLTTFWMLKLLVFLFLFWSP